MRIIPPLERYDWLVAAVQNVFGKSLLLAAFATVLWLAGKSWWLEFTVVAALTSWLPHWRRPIILGGTLYWLLGNAWFDREAAADIFVSLGVDGVLNWWSTWSSALGVCFVFLAAYLLLTLYLKQKRRRWFPVGVFVTSYGAMLASVELAPLSTVQQAWLWIFLIVLGQYLWFFCYTLIDMQTARPTPLWQQVGFWMPFWQGTANTATPFPKGATYLARIEAGDARSLAIVQLKGFKLLLWAMVLTALYGAYRAVVYGEPTALQLPTLDIPTLREAIAASVAGTPVPWYLNWAALAANFFRDILQLAIWGHVVIACVRLVGFDALRNTYRPLESRSIAEFWNRYYYYFKELLAECFFYPVFLRFFKKHPRLRVAAAVFAAAGVGNFIYHFFRDVEYIALHGFWQALYDFRVYLFYVAVLSVGISISMLRSMGGARGRVGPRLRDPVVVLSFYALLSIFDDPDRTLSLTDHFVFAGRLVGL